MTVEMDVEPAVFDDETLALQYIINSLINNRVNTCEVVKVVSVDESKNEIAVIPIVKDVDAMGEAIEESVIYGIKYIRWQHGANAIIAVPEVGDVGLMLVSKRDISKIDAGIVDSRRKFNFADGIYIGGLCGFNQEPTQFIRFTANGIEITSPTAVAVTAPTASITTTGDTTITAGGNATITATGNATITGNAIAITGSTVAISGSAVSLGSGSTPKAVALDGDPVYSGTKLVGNVRASSTEVVAN